MFTPIKPKSRGVLNDTVLNTPLPQASSTVQRRSRFGNEKQSNNEMPDKEDNSSLGILNSMSVLTNISATEDEQKLDYLNTDAQLESARKLLQRCSNIMSENDNLPILNLDLPKLNQETNVDSMINKTNIIFEPNEITGRSSGISNCSKEQSGFINQSAKGFDFSTSEIMAQLDDELIAQINKEEFLSGSKMAEKLTLDEACWKPNFTYSTVPVITTEKQKLLGSFSDSIGQQNLSLKSCAEQNVSMGQYFACKSNNIGNILENEDKIRPNFSFNTQTPIRTNKPRPLIESTVISDATVTSTKLEEKKHIPNVTRDNIDEASIISLSTIAHALEDVNNATPRRIVDELLMIQKKKNPYPVIQNNASTETYTLSSDKSSMLTGSIENSKKFDKDVNLEVPSIKLSLSNNEPKNETIDMKQECLRMLSFSSKKPEQQNACKEITIKEQEANKSISSFKQNAVSPNNEFKISYIPLKTSRKSFDEESYSNLNVQRQQEIKQEISNNMIGSLFSMSTDTEIQHDVVIGNTDQLCNCIVGMLSEINIELVNNGNRWIKYHIELIEVRGDKQSIELITTQEECLLKPNGTQSTKIGVKIIKMCKPIFVEFNIILIDMVSKKKWCMKHMIFVNPEQLEFDVICDSNKQELDFQYIAKNCTKFLPISLYNKNSVDIPVQLSISHDGLEIFSIDSTTDGPIKLSESYDKSTHLILKAHEKYTAKVRCDLQSTLKDSSQKQPQYWKSKLIVRVQCDKDTILFQKEVPLYAQIGICKIHVIDTEIPIIVSKEQSKSLNIINSGNVATHVFATVVPMEGHLNAVQDFSIKPDNIFLQPKENGSFSIEYKPQFSDMNSTCDERYAKIKLVAGSNIYHYIVCTKQQLDLRTDNYLRCQTPSNVVTLSPATSPQSVTSTVSGPYDRNSPISTASSVAVAGNKIPIKTTHAALAWNSTKIGKSEIKELTIRNTSDNKIKIQVDICDDSKSFKFLSDRQTVNTSMVLVMQRQEIKTFSVIFSPYKIGAVVGKIGIKHYIKEVDDSQQYKIIPLYGYGGCSKLKISNTFNDPSGKMWLKLGTLDFETTPLSATVTLQNIGDLRSFAKIKIIPKGISPIINSNWNVHPKELILDPKEIQQISIKYQPKKEDFMILQRSAVSHVATINITYGDEPTRWRIRRLYEKIKQSGALTGNENEEFKDIVQPICQFFPGEQLSTGLTRIRDSVQHLSDLCAGIQQCEITLTVEACPDDSLPVHYDHDESGFYYSLINDTTQMDDVGETSFFPSQAMTEHNSQYVDLEEEKITISPSIVVLNPPLSNEATVTVVNSFKVPQSFQTNLSNMNFSVVPTEGMLLSGKKFFLKIQCSQRIQHNIQDILEIYTENHKQDVLIKVYPKRQ